MIADVCNRPGYKSTAFFDFNIDDPRCNNTNYCFKTQVGDQRRKSTCKGQKMTNTDINGTESYNDTRIS